MLVQVTSVAQRSTADSAYIALLERTNQQLGLWTNPYGVLIASLAALFTFLTIAAAFLLYRQSREHDQRIEKFLTKAQSVLDALVDQTKIQTSSAIADLQQSLSKIGPGEEKQKLEKRIDRLQEFVNTLPTHPSSPTSDVLRAASGASGGWLKPPNIIVCSRCGAEFPKSGLGIGPTFTQCPNCGSLIKI